MPAFDAPAEIVSQLTWWWDHLFWPRLDGLTDDEFFWEPVPGCLSVRRGSDGVLTLDEERTPFGERGPFTTIAWRMTHISNDVFALRIATHFDQTATSHADFVPPPLPGSASEGLAILAEYYERWVQGVTALGAEGFACPCGPAEHVFAENPFGGLVLHINRETIHHGAEIMTVRDLYAART